MKVIKGSNFGVNGINNYQVIVSASLKGASLEEQELAEIIQKFNGPSGEISLRLYHLRRHIQFGVNKGNLTGYILYASQDSFSALDWGLIENDLQAVTEQLNMILEPYK
jgi:hypothetical protein